MQNIIFNIPLYTSPALPPVYIQNSHPSLRQRLLCSVGRALVSLEIQCRGFDSQLHFSYMYVYLSDTRIYLTLKNLILIFTWFALKQIWEVILCTTISILVPATVEEFQPFQILSFIFFFLDQLKQW